MGRGSGLVAPVSMVAVPIPPVLSIVTVVAVLGGVVGGVVGGATA